MADLVVMSPKLYVAGIDFSGDVGALALNYGCDAVEDTKANNGGVHAYQGGVKTADAQFEGMVNESVVAGPVTNEDELIFPKVALSDQPLILGIDPGTEGSLALMARIIAGKYDQGAAVGEMLKFSLGLQMSVGTLRRGKIIVDASAAKTVSGNGTAFQLGAVGAGQKVYACLQVLKASGTTPNLVGILQSDNAVGFPSPLTTITFGAKTAAGQTEWAELAGANTDDWWRLNYTITGTTPSFTLVLAVAIF